MQFRFRKTADGVTQLRSVKFPGNEEWFTVPSDSNDIDKHWVVIADYQDELRGNFTQKTLKIELAKSANSFIYSNGPLMDYWYEKQRLINLAFGDLPDLAMNVMLLLGLPDCMQNQLAILDFKSIEELRKAVERLKPFAARQPAVQGGNRPELQGPGTKNQDDKLFPISCNQMSFYVA
ncbi:hypothetical protein GE061_009102 [Apolygus lucorum]|uniref:Uncharacterized protein n=1 Tax=Apolygus lucorum TaxID=248454 RepID=A0A8S9XZ74_APOLU|nr:hypothetical protein GE061_009102 [Apolygus lucorum]